MTPSRLDPDPYPGSESIGAMLTRVRLASGRSQLRLAELLCAASGVSTITRHEVSRWEREERIPGVHWLRWLATVLDLPLAELEGATAIARARRGDTDPEPGDTECGGTEPGDPADVPWDPHSDGTAGGLSARIAILRRMDDLVGGPDLAALTGRELSAAADLLRAPDLSEQARRRLLPQVAELAQLACWVAADAGAPAAAWRAYRLGVETATAAGSYPLLGHLMGSLAHLSTGADTDPSATVELARRAYRLARPGTSATGRALLLQRVAFAAARAGRRRAGEQALAGAERAFQRRDDSLDPPWLYWFHDAELTAMTGRCYAALGRPRLAEPLLRAALDDPRIRLRGWALYAG
ncbi:MAG: hypothetical protein QOI74_27, partial [Micromonosporaceae bacterium]|nr:hypothetical protein [Micromonosporaceae bacterium]